MVADPPILRFERLSKHYGGVAALDGVSGQICEGERVAIIGRSGAGKSTLLRCLNRLNDATDGAVYLRERDVTRVQGARLRGLRHDVGMIFQQFNLVGRLTVLQNVLVGRLRFSAAPHVYLGSVFRWMGRSDQELAIEALRRVGIEEQAGKRADELSGGQQQRVAIARLLCQQPSVILADEPIASLDPRSAEAVMRLLADITERDGIPLMVNLHHIDVARRFATRVIGMHAGRIVFDGPVGDLCDDAVSRIYGDGRHDACVSPEDESERRSIA